ncbi:MAG: DUF1850 domain-containing protein [Spirochaetaceae bacterium]
MNEQRSNRGATAFLLLVCILVLPIAVACTEETRDVLHIVRGNEENTVARVHLNQHQEFFLRYIHSVSRTEVEGSFELTGDGRIRPLTTRFLAFGPGLPWTPGTEHVVDDSGRILVLHDEEPRDEIRLWVSELTQETIATDDREIPLYSEGGEFERVIIRSELPRSEREP